MDVRNEAEAVVGREVRRRGRRGAGAAPRSLLGIPSWLSRGAGPGPVACTCPLCTVDSVAYALTKVQPCYARSHNFGFTAQWVDQDRVRAAVETAIDKVGRRPRHASRHVPREAGSVRLVDFSLEAGTQVLEPILRSQEGLCRCTDCQEDTLAYALNRVAPRYGVEVLGRRRMPSHLMEFVSHDLATAILRASRVIAANPRH